MSTTKENIQWLDTLRSLATLGVILIHVSSPIINTTPISNSGYWWIGNLLMSLTRYAVPMFLLLSGTTMLGREYNLKEYYKRRLMRVVFPFLFWIIVYFFFRYFTLPATKIPEGFSATMSWAGHLFLTEGVSKHFWYIYMIIFIYLFVPFLSGFANRIENKNVPVLLFIWLLIASWCTRYGANMYLFTDVNRIGKYFLFMGYLLAGFYFFRNIIITQKLRYTVFIVFLLSIFISAFTVYFISIGNQKTDQSIYNYMSFNTIIQSVALFLLIKNTSVKNKALKYINEKISDYSYGIYLVHIMVLGILFNHGIFWTMAHPLISVPVVFLLTLIISFIIIFLLRKIPYGKYIAG